MEAGLRTHDRLEELRVWLDDALASDMVGEICESLGSEAEAINRLAGATDSPNSRRAQELIITMRDHLRWVVEHRHFALLFELTRELKHAHGCGVEAWTLVMPAVAHMGERQLAV
jgi:hypothetical protein